MTTTLSETQRDLAQKWDPFQLMDALDDEAILLELEGIAATDLVYTIKDRGGKLVTGLSKGGIDECCNVLAHRGEVIREEEVTYSFLGDGYEREALFTVRAARWAVAKDGREVRLDQVFGTKRQALFQTVRGQEPSQNPHWFEQGSMKACRNARARLVPAQIKAEVIARAKQAGRERRVGAPDRAEPMPKGPPAPDTPSGPDAPAAAPGDPLTRETPIPWANGKKLRELSMKQVEWLLKPGNIAGPRLEEWLALFRAEVTAREGVPRE